MSDFDDFARTNARALVRTAYLLTGNRQDAEDLAQETLLNVYRHWRLVSVAENPGAYVHRTLVNRFISQRRRRRLVTVPFTDLSPELGSAEDIGTRVSQREELRLAIDSLPPREKAAVVLRYLTHLSHSEIADAMGTTESTARSTVSRGTQALRQLFAEPIHIGTKEET